MMINRVVSIDVSTMNLRSKKKRQKRKGKKEKAGLLQGIVNRNKTIKTDVPG